MTKRRDNIFVDDDDDDDDAVSDSEAVRTQLATQDRTIGFHDVRLAELDLRVQCAETTNYDGVLVWKIIEYQRRKREAISGAVPPINYCPEPAPGLPEQARSVSEKA